MHKISEPVYWMNSEMIGYTGITARAITHGTIVSYSMQVHVVCQLHVHVINEIKCLVVVVFMPSVYRLAKAWVHKILWRCIRAAQQSNFISFNSDIIIMHTLDNSFQIVYID